MRLSEFNWNEWLKLWQWNKSFCGACAAHRDVSTILQTLLSQCKLVGKGHYKNRLQSRVLLLGAWVPPTIELHSGSSETYGWCHGGSVRYFIVSDFTCPWWATCVFSPCVFPLFVVVHSYSLCLICFIWFIFSLVFEYFVFGSWFFLSANFLSFWHLFLNISCLESAFR